MAEEVFRQIIRTSEVYDNFAVFFGWLLSQNDRRRLAFGRPDFKHCVPIESSYHFANCVQIFILTSQIERPFFERVTGVTDVDLAQAAEHLVNALEVTTGNPAMDHFSLLSAR